MAWESLEAIGTALAAVVAIFTLLSQNKAFRANLAADLAMKLDDRFSSSEFKKIRSRAALALRDHAAEEEAEDVFDFFETVGLFTRRKALDAELVRSFFFHWVNLYWVAGKDHIAKRQSESSSVWKDFGDLYLKVLKIEMEKDPSSGDISLSPAKLERYLNDEIELS